MELIRLELPSEEELHFEIALVDEPAIESDWMAFNKDLKDRYAFQEADKKEKTLMGYFMIADLEIPRFDARGQYNVVFPKDAIDKIVRNFSKNGLNKNMNEMHQTGELLEGVYVLHQWQLDKEKGINAPNGFKQEADGSWFGVVKCENEEIYQKALNGELNGFSIEGRFIEEEVFNKAFEKFLTELENLT